MNKLLLTFLTLFFAIGAFAGNEPKAISADKNPIVKSYPNPVINDLNIEIQLGYINQYNKVEIKIVNLLGQQMVAMVKEDLNAVSNSFKIDLREIPAGIYFIEVVTMATDGVSYTHTKKITKN